MGMKRLRAVNNVAFPWAALLAITTCIPFWQVACDGNAGTAVVPSSASLRATAAAKKVEADDEPRLWRRPVLRRPTMVNGSLTLHALNVSGKAYSNSVCASMMDFAVVADVSASVGNVGVVGTQLFLARLSNRLRLGQGEGQQLAGLIEAGMEARLMTGLTGNKTKFVDGVTKLTLRGGAMNMLEAMGMAETSFMYGRKHAHGLVLAIVDGPVLRQRLVVQQARKISRSADLVVILVADEFDVAAQRDAMEWLEAAGSCTPYGCRLLQVPDYESLAIVDTTGVVAEICPDLC